MKKTLLISMLCLLLVACAVPAFAVEAPLYDAGEAQNDPQVFAQALGAMNWQMPVGYTLETFARGDLSHDNQNDSVVASLLADDGITRMLAVFIGNPSDQHVFTSMTALPPADDMSGAFLGFSVNPGSFTIHIAGEDKHTSYTFGYHGGLFYLDNLFVTRWDVATLAAAQQIYLLDMGSYAAKTGYMQEDAFIAENVDVQHQFDPELAMITLDAFDIATFPLEWDAFDALISSRAKPTARPTSKPRPTQQPMPGPMYPTDEPMPGPVYPTDEPMPGPIDWDGGNE